jgi:hypothetical protein
VCTWAKLLDSTVTVGALNTDAAGNFYIAGTITRSHPVQNRVLRVPFDNINLDVAAVMQSGFLAKYNQAGVCQWVTVIATVVPQSDFSWTVPNASFFMQRACRPCIGNYCHHGPIWRKPHLVEHGHDNERRRNVPGEM